MQVISNIEEMERRVHRDCDKLIANMHQLTSRPHATATESIAILSEVRRECAEDLNQIQHEYLVLQGAKWLIENGHVPPTASWSWNPRQSGGPNEPDLQAVVDGVVSVSAEVTTSLRPEGLIDSRMRDTLRKLAAAPGVRFYFVATEYMAQRARTKISRNGHAVEAVCLRPRAAA